MNFVICENITDQTFEPLSVHENTHQIQTFCEREKKLNHRNFKKPKSEAKRFLIKKNTSSVQNSVCSNNKKQKTSILF